MHLSSLKTKIVTADRPERSGGVSATHEHRGREGDSTCNAVVMGGRDALHFVPGHPAMTIFLFFGDEGFEAYVIASLKVASKGGSFLRIALANAPA